MEKTALTPRAGEKNTNTYTDDAEEMDYADRFDVRKEDGRTRECDDIRRVVWGGLTTWEYRIIILTYIGISVNNKLCYSHL